MSKEIRVETEIEGTPEEVYKAIVDPSQYKTWDIHPSRTVSDIRSGGLMTWRLGEYEGGISFVQVEPGLRWIADLNFVPGRTVRSEIEFSRTSYGVRVMLTIRDPSTDPGSPEAYSRVQDGWGGWVEDLKAHVEVAKGRVLTKVVEDLRIASQTVEESDVERLYGRLGATGFKVVEEVRKQNADAVGTIVVYHSRDPWKVEVGSALEGEMEPTNGLQVRNLEGGLVVAKPYRRHSNRYPLFLYDGMEKWCGLNGYRPVGPVREIYTDNIWDQKAPVPGEVQVPVTRRQRKR